MNNFALKALEGSIKKWERIVARKGVDNETANCPLCDMFYDSSCSNCPVSEKVEAIWCQKTPFDAWDKHQEDVHSDKKTRRVFKNCPKCKPLAQAELDFLKSLLPKSGQ